MNTDPLLDSPSRDKKKIIEFEFTSFDLSRAGVDFIEEEIKKYGLANQLKSLADKIGVFINYLKENKSNINDKENILSILNQKKIMLSQYSIKYKKWQENYISDYNYYSNLLKIYEKNFKKLKAKNDKDLIINSSYLIQQEMGEKLEEFIKLHNFLLFTINEESEIINYYFDKYNYKY